MAARAHNRQHRVVAAQAGHEQRGLATGNDFSSSMLQLLTCMMVSATVTGSPVAGDSSGCPVVAFSTGCCHLSAVISLITNPRITQAIGLIQ